MNLLCHRTAKREGEEEVIKHGMILPSYPSVKAQNSYEGLLSSRPFKLFSLSESMR